jgi:hypothetical protein
MSGPGTVRATDGKKKPKHEKNDPGAREAWMKAKPEGRPRQRWVWTAGPDEQGRGYGYWEKV